MLVTEVDKRFHACRNTIYIPAKLIKKTSMGQYITKRIGMINSWAVAMAWRLFCKAWSG